MKRRKFISALSAATVLPSLLDGFSFKTFAASPLLQALANSTNNDHVLVLIQLNGGNDGLNTVIPLDQYSQLAAARNNILIPSAQVLALNGTIATGLHPSMSGFQQLYNNGLANIIQGVSYPSPNFSHFRATDIWLSGSDSSQVLSTGWAGRYLDYEYPNFPVGYPNATVPDPLALEIGSTISLALQGPAVSMGMSITNPTNFYNLINGIQDPAPNTNYGKELTYIRQVSQQSQAYSTVITTAANNITQQSASYPAAGTNSLADQLKIVARLIAGGLQTKIYMVNLGGFDTHSAQAGTDTTTGTHATLLSKLSVAISAFMDDLNYLSVANRVVGMTFSEFGRRIISNGSTGTDHGVGAPMLLFGNSVQNGILGNNPIIPSGATVNDNVAMQYDFRSVYASVLNEWFCVPQGDLNQIMLQNFQLLPIIQSNACSVTGIHELNQQAGENLVWNHPNPFTSSSYISFKSKGGHVLLQVFNTEGQLIKTIADGDYAEGTYKLWYENEGRAAGIYYLRLQNEAIQQVKNMVVVQ